MDNNENYLRQRELIFKGPQNENQQIEAAWLMLREADAVMEVRSGGDNRLWVSYDIRRITYAEIEQALIEVGFHLDNSLISKLRRALYHYQEDTIRANLGLTRETLKGVAQKVFIHHYQQQYHGCRDQRPRHWREYL